MVCFLQPEMIMTLIDFGAKDSQLPNECSFSQAFYLAPIKGNN